MKKISLREFIFGMKKADPNKKGLCQLFIVDDSSEEIYACALGRALLESGVVDKDIILDECSKSRDGVVVGTFTNPITNKPFKGRISSDLESKWTDWIKKSFGKTFYNFITHENDSQPKLPISEIGVAAYNEFSSDLDNLVGVVNNE